MKITKKQIRDFYHKEGLVETSHQSFVYSKKTSATRKNSVETLLSKHLDENKRPRVLEIGCADGMYCVFLSQTCELVVGLDISRPKIERATRLNNIVYMVGDWDNLPFPSKSFDLVLATECIEHSLDPEKLVGGLFRVTDKILVTVPIKENKIADPMNHPSGHIHAFNQNSIRELFKDHNIKEEMVNEPVGYMALVVEE